MRTFESDYYLEPSDGTGGGESAPQEQGIEDLTYEQARVLDMLRQGLEVAVIARFRGAQPAEIEDLRDELAPFLKPASLESQEVTIQEQPPLARENITQFLSWMYPKERIGAETMSDQELMAVADRIQAAMREYVRRLPTPKHRRQVKPATNYVKSWFEGRDVIRIADENGKNEGTVRLSLTGFAEKLGAKMPFEEIVGGQDTGAHSN